MKNDSPPARDDVISRIRNSTTAQLFIVVIVAIAFFLAMRYWAVSSECGAHDHDGQCGMSTLFGQVFGALGAIIIWIGASGQIQWRSAAASASFGASGFMATTRWTQCTTAGRRCFRIVSRMIGGVTLENMGAETDDGECSSATAGALTADLIHDRVRLEARDVWREASLVW